MLEKKVEYAYNIDKFGHIQVRKLTGIYEDDKFLSETIHIEGNYPPEADIATQSQKVKDIAAVVWTADVIKKYKDKIKEKEG